jgi:hypothetical protein
MGRPYIARMSQDRTARTKALSAREVMDLVRAGIVLAITVYLTMIVPPQVWGADSAPEPAQVNSPQSPGGSNQK